MTGHRQQLSGQWLLLVSSLFAEKTSHTGTGPSPPARSPTWGWEWSSAGDVAPAGRRDASEINRCYHTGATPCWMGLFPSTPCPAALPCTCHVSKCKVTFPQGPDPADGGHRTVWSSRFPCLLHRAERERVRGWEKPRTADCSHALTGASCHSCRKALDLAAGRRHRSPRSSRYTAYPRLMLQNPVLSPRRALHQI